MEKVKIGVLGMANIALRSVVPAILELSDKFEFVGIATRNKSNNKESKEDFKIIEGYESLIEEEQLDAVYIPLPNSLHYEWVKQALNNNIHVLVEKSMACTFEQVVELNELAKNKNLALVENFQFRFHSQLNEIREIIDSKILGKFRIFRTSFCFPPFPDKDNIRYSKELGGGALLDAGAYPLKVSQLLLGNDLEVQTATLNYEDNYEVDIWGGAYLKHKTEKIFSQIAFGFDNFYQCNVEIVGSKGRLYTNRIFTANEKVNPVLILETQGNGAEERVLEKDNHFKNMLSYFHSLVIGQESKEKEYLDNINQARLINELRNKSHE